MAVPLNEIATSAFYPADNPATIAHLNSLQAIITRLGREKAYRELYSSVSAHVRNGTYALTDCFNLTPA